MASRSTRAKGASIPWKIDSSSSYERSPGGAPEPWLGNGQRRLSAWIAGPACRPPAASPPVLVMAAVSSVQFGSALAKTLFDEVGPGGTVFLRLLLAALVLTLIWRPTVEATAGAICGSSSVRPHPRRDEPGLLRVARPDPARGGGDVRVRRSAWRGGVGLASPARPRLGRARRGRDRAAVRFRLVRSRRGRRGLRPPRRRLLGGLHPPQRARGPGVPGRERPGAGDAGGRGAARARGRGRRWHGHAGARGAGHRAAVALLSSAIPYSLEMEALRSLPKRCSGCS